MGVYPGGGVIKNLEGGEEKMNVVAGVEICKKITKSLLVEEKECEQGGGNEQKGVGLLEKRLVELGDGGGSEIFKFGKEEGGQVGEEENDTRRFGKLGDDSPKGGEPVFFLGEIIDRGDEASKKEGFRRANGTDNEPAGRKNGKDKGEPEGIMAIG